MSWAETLAKLGRADEAVQAWRRVLEFHGYARARVQLSELYIARGENELARRELTELLADEEHAASFQRKQDKPWVNRANALLRQIKAS
jgi:hypothetical protein